MSDSEKSVFKEKSQQENLNNSKNEVRSFNLLFQLAFFTFIVIAAAYGMHYVLLSEIGRTCICLKNTICWLVLVYDASILKEICIVFKDTITQMQLK